MLFLHHLTSQNWLLIGNSVKEGDLSNNLKEAQKAVQKAILDRNYDEFKKYISEDMQLISGDSNLQDFYEFNEESFSRNA